MLTLGIVIVGFSALRLDKSVSQDVFSLQAKRKPPQSCCDSAASIAVELF